jgi:hypothetical protein
MRLCMKEPKNSIALLQIDNFHYRSQLMKQAAERPPTMKDRYDRNKKI